MTLPLSYYRHHDVLFLSRDLLGKFLFTHIDSVTTGGMIIETEAYRGVEDRASHAYGNRRTKRTEVMFQEGGVCYIYQCYGIHFLFNVVTHEENTPHAILIRAIYPLVGIETMLKRRNKKQIDRSLCDGPGTLTQALGIGLKHNSLALDGQIIWIEDRHINIPSEAIEVGPRVGVEYAQEDALLPWRFRLKKGFVASFTREITQSSMNLND